MRVVRVVPTSPCQPCRILKKNSVARVRERTIPTERPPLVSEVSANFCGQRVVSTTNPYGRNLDFLDQMQNPYHYG
jgi:hypothetical protein